MEEKDLYRSLLGDDPRALEDIIDAYGSCVYRLIFRILGRLASSRDVEECSSDAFAAVWEKRRRYDPERAPLRTWVLVLARYKALDCRRKLAARQEASLPDLFPAGEPSHREDPEEVFLRKERRETVQEAMMALPEEEREALYRRYFLEESAAEIAASLNISRGAVDTRLWRARKTLKRYLKQQEEKVVPYDG